MHTIHIKSLLGTEIRSRMTNGDRIRNEIRKAGTPAILLDFSEVQFVSRSFADELCMILDEHPNIKIFGDQGVVRSMIDTVMTARKRVRQRDTSCDKQDIKVLHTISELYEYARNI